MRKGYKLINVSDQRPDRHTGTVVPRKWSGLGTTIAPGEAINVGEEIPGEVAAYLADEETGILKAVAVDLITGEELEPQAETEAEASPQEEAPVAEPPVEEVAPTRRQRQQDSTEEEDSQG